MILLSVNHIKKVYGAKTLFENLSMSIEHTDRIGIIGINGTGKSSLLKILAGQEGIEAGEIALTHHTVVEYLPQNPVFNENSTVIEQIFRGDSPFMKILREYESTVEALNQDPNDPALQQKLMALSVKMDEVGAWQLESEAKAILIQLGIAAFNQKISELSGGQRKKIALAGALIRPCDILILDEPTNHLDNETIDYLEEFLKVKKCAVVMVTHDRYFLDRIVNQIIELDQGELYFYKGNYENFVTLKAQREEMEERMKEKQLSSYKKELEWMKKGVEARRTKQKARQERFYELEKSIDHSAKQQLDIGLGTSRLGKKIIHLEHITKYFGSACIINDFTYTVLRGDRIGIIGRNGTGKSTLLNIITGEIGCDKGIIEIGETVKIGYYTQENKEMDLSQRVIDYIKDRGEYVKLADGTALSASKMLERFLFTGPMQYTSIGKLSGGERRRLYLLGILMEDINVLLLDEPTNDLDIYTLQVLEGYIDDFNGPVIAVSHDRYFLDRMAEKIFVCEGAGKITSYPGNYSDYFLKKQAQDRFKENDLKKTKAAVPQEGTKSSRPQNILPKLKFTYHEKLEYDKIDQVIADLEDLLKYVEEQISEYATDFSKLQELTKQKEDVESQLTDKLSRWEYLNELAEKIAHQS